MEERGPRVPRGVRAMKQASGRRIALSVGDLAGPDPPPDWIEHVAAIECSHVELWTPWHVTLTTAREVGRRLDAVGVHVACVSSPSFLHGDETGRGAALVADSIDVASALGCPLVNTYFGHGGDGDDRAAAARYAALLEPLLRRAERMGVTIALENEFDAFGHDPRHTDISRRPHSLKELVEMVGSPSFGLNLDPANFLCAGQDVASAADLLAPHTVYCHVKDVVEVDVDASPDHPWKIFADGDRRFRTVRLGEGEVDWPAVLFALRAAGYSGPCTLEPHCGREAVAEEARAAVAYLSTVVGGRQSAPSARGSGAGAWA